MTQSPGCGEYLLRWKGDALTVTLKLDAPRKGRAALRTNIGGASMRRREIINHTEKGETPLARAWRDIPMEEVGPGLFSCSTRLDEVGIFSCKACFFPDGSNVPEWPEGENFHVKVEPASTRRANSIYTVFPRQFGGALFRNPEDEPGVREAQSFLEQKGYCAIPPSGTFRDVVRSLDHIMGKMGFKIVQLLPVFPVPTTFARMGRYGCPFAATDFLSVDPALAEFDPRATPLDQFRELVDAVHARGGAIYVDLPANHTGWAATLQTHHPEWYHREKDGRFVSPGAWGVTWEDLVELDFSNPELRVYMADVFLFWCRLGVDGFRCDAGYMIPAETWTYIVARVREEHPDTVFMLEGLGGKLEVTNSLLMESGLDWAYSEMFQTYDRGGFEWYLPGAISRAEKYGALVHFAETHDNDRLAKRGVVYARMRVQLAALLSHQGAWGIANGVEWFATEKIDVHGASSLNWGAKDNMVDLIARLNGILSGHPAFGPGTRLQLVTRGEGNTLAVLRKAEDCNVLVLANLDCGNSCTARWDGASFPTAEVTDIVRGRKLKVDPGKGVVLAPGEVMCLAVAGQEAWKCNVAADGGCAENAGPFVTWRWPEDARRDVCVPSGCALRIEAPCSFRARIADEDGRTVACGGSGSDSVIAPLPYLGDGTRARVFSMEMAAFSKKGVERAKSRVMVLPSGDVARVKLEYSGDDIRRDPRLETMLGDGSGSMARVKLAWGTIGSQYDALFAANADPAVPADRLVLWTRCRAWLQHEGYSRELNGDCVESFRADPAGRFATWRFRVPCGLGKVARFSFTLSLAQDGGPAARLAVRRLDDGGGCVRIVFRPDIEWRSFHATTKAQGDVERAFGAPNALRMAPDCKGFSFSPYPAGGELDFKVRGGTCHFCPQWTYCVAHPEEASRGQESCGDLYSPCWVSCDMQGGSEAVVTAIYRRPSGGTKASLRFPSLSESSDVEGESSISVPAALQEAMRLFVVRRDDVKTVIAGYPWFLDWGRDTFIFLRGAIAAGFLREACDIVAAFARFEENGTLPNIIHGATAGNRDTTDAPLWFILAVRDICAKRGRKRFLSTDCGGRTLEEVVESILSRYVSGTPNGIRVDEASGLVWSPSHFTWMDTNYPACTPRIGYPVEIQALWIASLRFAGGRWKGLADRAAASLVRLYSNGHGLADCLDAPGGESAAKAARDDAVRPNQLMVLSLGALPADAPEDLPRQIVDACEPLVVPGGIRSLSATHLLYRGVYAGDEDSRRKPAYHNGTVWAWPFPMYVEAALACGRIGVKESLSLLASVVENINTGCVCHISEIADGDSPHALKGCLAQAWSVSEMLRVWKVVCLRTRDDM